MRRLCLTIIILMLLLSSASSAAAQPVPDQLALAWTADSATTQTISWRLPEAVESAQVQYVAGTAADFQAAQTVSAAAAPLTAGYNRWQATVRGLCADTVYTYRVGAPGCWSAPAHFRTGGAAAFSFIYLGDPQQRPASDGQAAGGYGAWGQLLQRAATETSEPRFVLLGGDLVNEGNDGAEWAQFWAAATPIAAQLPFLATPGNHDGGALFNAYFCHLGNGPKSTVYSCDYGLVHLVVLDSNDIAYTQWLADDLAATAQPYKIVMFHTPAYPVNANYKDALKAETIRAAWGPVLEQGGVDLVLNGHQHVYARTVPLCGGQADDSGVTYLVGVSGGKLYPAADQPYLAQVVTGVPSYTVINVSPQALSLITKDANGQVLDRYLVRSRSLWPGLVLPLAAPEMITGGK